MCESVRARVCFKKPYGAKHKLPYEREGGRGAQPVNALGTN